MNTANLVRFSDATWQHASDTSNRNTVLLVWTGEDGTVLALQRVTSGSVHYLKETVCDFKVSFPSDWLGKMCGVYVSHSHF